jgi:hypothetical protein
MTLYARKTSARTPEGRHVLVATVRNPIVTESSVFPADENGTVASAMHLARVKHGVDDDLDTEHEALVAAVEAGEVELHDREATPDEAREALGDLILLANMAIDDQDQIVH